MDNQEKKRIIIGARDWLDTNLPIALELRNISYSKMLILSTIDCFAQMWGNYPLRRDNRTFCNFVLKYSQQNDLFRQVCPITLHYHYVKDNPLKLQRGRIYKWNDNELVVEANRILQSIDDAIREKARHQHSYIQLLYRLRSQLVHELNNIGTRIEFNNDIPSVASGIDEGGERIWSLNYPRLWLYKLAKETIYNFIDDCIKSEELLCFLDNPRRVYLTWYE